MVPASPEIGVERQRSPRPERRPKAAVLFADNDAGN
jgi:hypothetical protein